MRYVETPVNDKSYVAIRCDCCGHHSKYPSDFRVYIIGERAIDICGDCVQRAVETMWRQKEA